MLLSKNKKMTHHFEAWKIGILRIKRSPTLADYPDQALYLNALT
jgi:hypothetical protein